jgi:hypothetical protein
MNPNSAPTRAEINPDLNPTNIIPGENLISEETETPSILDNLPSTEVELRRSTRLVKLPVRFGDYVCTSVVLISPVPDSISSAPHIADTAYALSFVLAYDKFFTNQHAILSSLDLHIEPTTYSHAIRDPKWQEAIAAELQALEQNKT